MKKLLLLSLVLSASFSNAQLLQSDTFNTLTVGNVGTDFTGATPGQGGWLTSAGNGTAPTTTTNSGNANFQIVADGNGSTNGFVIQGPNGNGGGKYMWKDGLTDSWEARTTGNDIIQVEVDFYTGAATTSTAFTGVYLYNTTGYDLLNGFIYTNNTRLLRGIARLNNAGDVDAYTVGLATGGMILAPDTWYRLGFGYNTVTGQPTWRLNTSTGTISIASTYWAADDVLSPDEVDLAAEASTTNAASYSGKFDNFTVKASATDTLLGAEDIATRTNAFSVFPNPAKNTINVSSYDYSINNVKITDINGRVVKNVAASSNEAQIDLSDLSQGVYMVKVTSNEGVSDIKKIVKQ